MVTFFPAFDLLVVGRSLGASVELHPTVYMSHQKAGKAGDTV